MRPLVFVDAKKTEMPAYAFIVDFDQTITNSVVNDDYSDRLDDLPKPNKKIVQRMRRAHDSGIPVVIFSYRWSSEVQGADDAKRARKLVEDYLKKYDIPYDSFWAADKPYGFIVDDNAANADDVERIDDKLDEMIRRKQDIAGHRITAFHVVRHNPDIKSEAEARVYDNIIFTGPKFEQLSKEAKAHVILHEEGHFFEHSFMGEDIWWSSPELLGDAGNLNGATTPAEIWAEAYAIWKEDPKWLDKNHPKLGKVMPELIEKYEAPGLKSHLQANDAKREFGCLMALIPSKIAEAVKSWGQENILDDVIFDDGSGKYGREKDSHVTVNFGFVEDPELEELQTMISEVLKKPIKARLGKISKFTPNDRYDVIKVEVLSSDLSRLHEALLEKYDINESHPDYKPHVTIAYVQPGSCDDVLGNEDFKDLEFEINEYDYSGKDNGHNKFSTGNLDVASCRPHLEEFLQLPADKSKKSEYGDDANGNLAEYTGTPAKKAEARADLIFVNHLLVSAGIVDDFMEAGVAKQKNKILTLNETLNLSAEQGLVKFWLRANGSIMQWTDESVEHAQALRDETGMSIVEAQNLGWVRGIIEGNLLVLQVGKNKTVTWALQQLPAAWLQVDRMITSADIGELQHTKVTEIRSDASALEAWNEGKSDIALGIRADRFSNLYRAAKAAVESDPKWAGYWAADAAVASEFGRLQHELNRARSEMEIVDIWRRYQPTTAFDSLLDLNEAERSTGIRTDSVAADGEVE